MKHSTRLALIILSIILLLSELLYGIPFLGGSIIVSFGWQPLIINAFFYLLLVIALLADSQSTIRPMVIIPLLGIAGSFIAIVPFVGMIVHWVLFFLMLFFLFIVMSTPIYMPNRNARAVYDEHGRRIK
ncbi:hypothetical protein [Staphylococcus simulans]|uniref:hypothetical protein n=1 Tax=Staphylococcus simulans TaxID=1286 RepID=UPI000D1E593C|nr:hypothetical protein [Staphylococcus simulans]MDY5060803.1 hypothetical protein [Staphylococcus simulans]PTJ15971.1 hypothetical protein BU038_07325 [Staphylococcus simulans]RIN77460.1 hypothetical protein BU015_05725 [Staphylococcus simulans]